VPAASQIAPRCSRIRSRFAAIGGGKLLADFVKDWSTAEMKAVTGAIRRGVFEGQTNSEIVQAIRGTRKARVCSTGLLETTSAARAQRRADGRAARVDHCADGDVRAELGHRRRRAVAQHPRQSHVHSCAALDLKEFPMDKGPRPPLHVNCRCTTVAVLKDEFAALNQRTARPSVGPRRRRAGERRPFLLRMAETAARRFPG
jgi:hypothetical protein